MRITLVTTRSAAFFGVFAKSYVDHNGPKIDNIIYLPDRGLSKTYIIRHIYLLLKLSGIRGITTLLLRKFSQEHLPNSLKDSGFLYGSDKSASILCKAGSTPLDCSSRKKLTECLENNPPDVLVSVGAPIIFTERILKTARTDSINVHNGNIPTYRGHFSTFWEIYNQEQNAFVSIHQMSKIVDSGAIYSKAATPITPRKNLLDLLIEKKQIGGQNLAELLRGKKFEPIKSSDPRGHHYDFPNLIDIYNCPKIKPRQP